MLKNIILAAVLLLFTACSGDQAATEVTPTAKASTPSAVSHFAKVAQHNLLFFLDPNGGPCRMQSGILSNMSGELRGKVNIRYVETTNKDDMQLFYKFGIRALPTLLFTDGAGREIKRLPPGIRDAATIRTLVNQLTAG